MRKHDKTDIALVGGGTLRGEVVLKPGKILYKDVMTVLPFEDPSVVLEMTGAQVKEALENGVAGVPDRLEGRFPQVSGLFFIYDVGRPVGNRVTEIKVGAHKDTAVPIDMARKYRVSTRQYMSEGKDGYDVMTKCKLLVSGEHGVIMASLLRNYIRQVYVINSFLRMNRQPLGDPVARAIAAFRGKASKCFGILVANASFPDQLNPFSVISHQVPPRIPS